jgi:hypothetical protein
MAPGNLISDQQEANHIKNFEKFLLREKMGCQT